jgi:hypothetical protein
LPALAVFFSRDARAQTHVEIGRSDYRLKAADQLPQRRALGVEGSASNTRAQVRRSVRTRPVTQFHLINFSPRVAAIKTFHDYTT